MMNKTYQCYSCGYIWSQTKPSEECPKCFSKRTVSCSDAYYRKDYIEDDSFVYDDDYGGKM